jgi:hypothetical protein
VRFSVLAPQLDATVDLLMSSIQGRASCHSLDLTSLLHPERLDSLHTPLLLRALTARILDLR